MVVRVWWCVSMLNYVLKGEHQDTNLLSLNKIPNSSNIVSQDRNNGVSAWSIFQTGQICHQSCGTLSGFMLEGDFNWLVTTAKLLWSFPETVWASLFFGPFLSITKRVSPILHEHLSPLVFHQTFNESSRHTVLELRCFSLCVLVSAKAECSNTRFLLTCRFRLRP